MSHHHHNRHTCSCQSSAHSHHRHCGCRMNHDANQHVSCSCSYSRHHQYKDSCSCKRVDRFPRNRFRRQDDRNNFNRRNRRFNSQSLSRLTPLRNHGHRDDFISHDHDRQAHGRNHSINEMIRLNNDDGKKNIVIIM